MADRTVRRSSDMTSQRWQRVHDLFEAACAVAPEARVDFLSQRCDGDDNLLREVESLLKFDNHDAPTLRNPTLPSVARMVDPADERAEEAAETIAAQRRLGAYELLRPLASGGMSMVWLGQRADDQFKQVVAVKVIKRGLEGPDVLTRFRNERQLLANLSHPNIARLLDGGVTDEGLPYLVMEYVDGQPIDKFCDQRSLAIPRRLDLFRTVCAAVACAHQSLIVHRDLKPANILVTAAGVPILLDFGIAKVLNPIERPGLDTITLLGARPMTPAYASPEQIRGRPITAASDIYSLGIVLYELLSGHRPYESPDGTPVDYVRAASDAPPPVRPSAATQRAAIRPAAGAPQGLPISPRELAARRELDPPRLRQRLSGDLDTIVLKAMERDPARRYASVEQFAEDVRRHLAGLPVRARPATFGYRTGKFVLRNRWSIAAATVVIAVVSALIVALWRQSQAASRERDVAIEAERQADQAADAERKVAARLRDAQSWNVKLLADINESGNNVRQVLDKSSRRLEELPPEDPQYEADLRAQLGRNYLGMNALEQAEREFERAAELRRAAVGPVAADVAAEYYPWATVLELLGRLTEAEDKLQIALAAQRRARGLRSSATAAGVNALGELLLTMHRYDDAQSVTAELAQRLDSPVPGEVVHGRLNYARALAHSDPAAGLFKLESLLAEERTRLGERAPDVARILLYVADCRLRLHDSTHAFAAAEPGAEILQGADPRRFAEARRILGAVLHDAREADRAERCYAEALSALSGADLADHPDAAECHVGLAALLVDRQRWTEAEEHLRAALAIRVRSAGPRTPLAAESMQLLGQLLAQLRSLPDALSLLREAVAIRRGAPLGSGRDFDLAEALDALADCCEKAGRPAEAIPVLKELSVLLDDLHGPDHAATQKVRQRLSECKGQPGSRPAEAAAGPLD